MTSANTRKHKWFGKLYAEEIELAKEVFGNTLPFERIFISNAKTHTQGITLATSPFRKRAKYLILWSNAYKTNIVESSEQMKATFIHELTHVWQGQHSGMNSMSYMTQSAWQQVRHGVRDIFKNGFGQGSKRIGEIFKLGFAKEWGKHRNCAYCFDCGEIGRDFNKFNVEQQALLVESWFAKEAFTLNGIEYPAGFQSEEDNRFPYIRDCIRMGKPNAVYRRY